MSEPQQQPSAIVPQQRTQMSEQIGDLAAALAAAQGAMENPTKDKENPFFKSSYADLASGLNAARKALADNKLAVVQTTEHGTDDVTIVTTLMHASGQWIRSYLTMRPTKLDPQGVGSAITYGRRYGFFGIVGLAPEDDDGNAASAEKHGAAQGPQQRPAATRTNPAAAPVRPGAPVTTRTAEDAEDRALVRVEIVGSLTDPNKLATPPQIALVKQLLIEDLQQVKHEAENWLKTNSPKPSSKDWTQADVKVMLDLIEKQRGELFNAQ